MLENAKMFSFLSKLEESKNISLKKIEEEGRMRRRSKRREMRLLRRER